MLTPEIGQLVTGEARSGVPGGVALPAIAPPSSVGSGSIDGAISDGSHIHSRRHRKDCTPREPSRVCERASHYGGESVQLIARDRARHLRRIPGKENEFRISCPRRDVLMANYLASIQIRRLNIHTAG